ncbi:MAG: hypothetical protein HQ522_12950, partial [Bacteroidetes bacterium]|nr:hypothetical protein [Bacteroidota bacterium]
EWVKPGKEIKIINATCEFGKINASMFINKIGATIEINPSFSCQVNQIAIAVPYFKTIKKVSTDTGNYEIKDNILYFPSKVKKIDIVWSDNKMQANNFQEILISYREEPGVKWVGGKNANKNVSPVTKMNTGSDLLVIPPGKGFLLEDEKRVKGQHLSFELVKEAYMKEYTRRYKQYIKVGKKPLVIKAPYF